jgi:ABC-type branched-subunit amino acid transport system substrate-binding protein
VLSQLKHSYVRSLKSERADKCRGGDDRGCHRERRRHRGFAADVLLIAIAAPVVADWLAPYSGAQGLILTISFYWDTDEQTRAWSKRFMERSGGVLPNLMTAGTYASVLHYLKAVEAAGTDEGAAVVAKMKQTPVNDFYNGDIKLRPDGRVMQKMFFMKVKSPAASKKHGDDYELLAELPGKEAYRPLSEGGCSFVSQR